MIGLSRLITVTATPPLYRLARLALSRFYSPSASAAAQPQADYYYYGAESASERLAAAAMADSEGSGPNRGVQWVFIGNPGAKRHVYAVRLAKLLEVPHISMASLVRQDLSPRSALYKQIANAVNHGELVPEDIIFGLLSKRLEDGYYQGENGFILDGIPRSPIQAILLYSDKKDARLDLIQLYFFLSVRILDQLVEIDLVVNFKCTEDCLVKHQRDGTWKEKLQVYAKQSKPLEEYYSKQKKLLDFQVGGAPGETWRGLLAALQLQHINAACSSHKLTTGFDWL